ncbi:MFS domain-containing protein [Aphelenchoides fujianensis]|nr:MFS domain-containing protein [Aphelenchoides fujianensis]
MDSSGSSADERERGNTADAIDPSASSPDHVLNKFDPWNPYILAVFVASASVWLFTGMNMMVSAWVTGYCLVAPIAYLLPYWRSLLVACSFPAVIFGVLYFFFLPESFHYMASTPLFSFFI